MSKACGISEDGTSVHAQVGRHSLAEPSARFELSTMQSLAANEARSESGIGAAPIRISSSLKVLFSSTNDPRSSNTCFSKSATTTEIAVFSWVFNWLQSHGCSIAAAPVRLSTAPP
jgi:hypothetical protein